MVPVASGTIRVIRLRTRPDACPRAVATGIELPVAPHAARHASATPGVFRCTRTYLAGARHLRPRQRLRREASSRSSAASPPQLCGVASERRADVGVESPASPSRASARKPASAAASFACRKRDARDAQRHALRRPLPASPTRCAPASSGRVRSISSLSRGFTSRSSLAGAIFWLLLLRLRTPQSGWPRLLTHRSRATAYAALTGFGQARAACAGDDRSSSCIARLLSRERDALNALGAAVACDARPGRRRVSSRPASR